MKRILIAAALFILAGTAGAQSKSAASNFYGELGYQNTRFEVDGQAGFNPTLGVATGILGYQFHPNFSGEIFLATGLSSGSSAGNIDTKLDHGIGVMLRPSYKFTDSFEAFARVGYGNYKVSMSYRGGSESASDSSLLYGIGANYYFTDKVYGQLSYTSFYDKDGASLKGWGVSLGYKF